MKKTLAQYLHENGLSRAEFAERIRVSEVSVTRYLSGSRFPNRTVLSLIEQVTDGEVLASSFLTNERVSVDM
jgi:transcriptional regulator with XRE-family HTH domain